MPAGSAVRHELHRMTLTPRRGRRRGGHGARLFRSATGARRITELNGCHNVPPSKQRWGEAERIAYGAESSKQLLFLRSCACPSGSWLSWALNGRPADRLAVVDAFRSLAQRFCRKSLCFALRRPVEEGDQIIDDGAPIRFRRDVRGDQALGLDAERRIDEGSGSHADVKWSRLSLVGSWLASPWPRRLRPSFQAGHSHAIRGAAEVN